MSYVELWVLAFLLTVVLEAPVVMIGARPALGWRRALAVGVGLQVLTHPALWFLAPRFEPYLLWVAVMELLITLVEGLVLGLLLRLAGQPTRAALTRGLVVSVLANSLSYLVGLLVVG